MGAKKALLIVDVQNDFCPGGALPVPDGDQIIPILNRYVAIFKKKKFSIFASRDWHPEKTRHFNTLGGKWPLHCIANTDGAAFHRDLELSGDVTVVSKGMDPESDSYSAFQAQDKNGTDLPNLLKMTEVKELYVGGLATDYCVKSSCLDAVKNGFKTKLLIDATKGVNINVGDSDQSIKEMKEKGVECVTVEQLATI